MRIKICNFGQEHQNHKLYLHLSLKHSPNVGCTRKSGSTAPDEIGHDGKLLDGVVRAVLGQEEDVSLTLGLVELEVSLPTALLDPIRVRPRPLHEPALLRRGHQHSAAPQLPPLLRRRQWVNVRVVKAEPSAADEIPSRVQETAVAGVCGLRAQRLFPPEVRVQERDAADRVAEPLDAAFLPQPYRHVGAGAVAGEDHAGRIPVLCKPGLALGVGAVWLRAARGGDRLQGGERIVVSGGETVLGGETVVDGDDDGWGLGGEE
jgi:hypothetical protein